MLIISWLLICAIITFGVRSQLIKRQQQGQKQAALIDVIRNKLNDETTNKNEAGVTRLEKPKSEFQTGYEYPCKYDLEYVQNTQQKRVLLQLKNSQQNLAGVKLNPQDLSDEAIINSKNYKAYLARYKPFQLSIINDNFNEEIFKFKAHTFQENVQNIKIHNNKPDKTYQMGLNQFTDTSSQQFSKIYNNNFLALKYVNIQYSRGSKRGRILQNLITKKNIFKQTHIDWRCKCPFTYNQGKCNSCYAFSTLDTLQISLRIIKKTQIPTLSVQQILSCARNNLTLLGCQGGYYEDVYSYVEAKGVGLSKYYPFESQAFKQGGQFDCNKQSIGSSEYRNNKYFVKGYKNIKRGACHQLLQALKTQVVVVTLHSDGLKQYKSGLYVPLSTSYHPDHGVTLVGYHPENKYIIKNSWGRQWGLNGFAYVGQQAGVCKLAIYPEIG